MAHTSEGLGELGKDEAFKSSVNKFHASVDNIGDALQLCCGNDVYETLSPEDKVEYDLFIAYSLNSLFWSFLRTQGTDPMKHGIKAELDRVRSYMARAKQVHDKKTMPRVDKEAAERFVTSGLWEPGQPKLRKSSGDKPGKRKRRDSDEES